MNFAEQAFRQTLYRLVLIQSVLVLGLTAVLFTLYEKTSEFSIALVYGGFVSVSVTILRAWRLKIATKDADSDLEKNFAASEAGSKYQSKTGLDTDTLSSDKLTAKVDALELFKGFALGYIVAIALLALGLSGLKLEPAAVIIGFVAAQLGHFFVRPPRPGAGRR